ncbi:MAG TPA: VWA domain-containing protein [Pyrinomonadaceae bacterium]|nr:VWA domain-containing protein [Pyrinomonadaceae bacterium]
MGRKVLQQQLVIDLRKAELKFKRAKIRSKLRLLFLFSLFSFAIIMAMGQAGRRPNTEGQSGVLMSVTATREDNSTGPVTINQIAIFENGIEQTIKNFSPDPSPARIVLLVDNSQTVRADVEKLEEAAREFAYEIYEGDQLLIVGYDEQAEIVADWTDDAKKIEESLKTFRKKGEPHLFDALKAVVEEALRPISGTTQKRVIVVIGDGLDRGSSTHFEDILGELQKQDITVYAVQLPDRTGGALRREQPKPNQVIAKITEGTGGLVFPIEEPRAAASAICDELRKNRYTLAYVPTNIIAGQARRLLITADTGIRVRARTMQP